MLELPGDRQQVVAAIAVGREREPFAAALEVAQPDADREDVHLPAGVVDVVLAMHAEAGRVEQVGERGAECCVSPVTHVQGAGRIRGHELDHHALAAAQLASPIALGEFEHAREFLVVGPRREVEVDKAGARDLDTRDAIAPGQRADDRLRELTGLSPREFRGLHRDVRRKVAVCRIARAFDRRPEALEVHAVADLRPKGGESLAQERFYQ